MFVFFLYFAKSNKPLLRTNNSVFNIENRKTTNKQKIFYKKSINLKKICMYMYVCMYIHIQTFK